MLRSVRPANSVVRKFIRHKSITGLTKPELEHNSVAQQSPNRAEPWAPSQESRTNILTRFAYRFIQKDLEQQPRPHSAMELISKQPIRYLKPEEGNVAVCDGNRESTLQGHPKIFINLDKPQAASCGYCGLRYAKEAHRHVIEHGEH